MSEQNDFNKQFLGQIANKRSSRMGKEILEAHKSQNNQQKRD